jgi:hypothetical protein
MRPLLTRCLALLIPCIFTAVVSAQTPLHEKIDHLISAGMPDYAKQVAGIASDAEFLRRITLDLTAITPSIAETRAFLADADPDKRRKLIDRLLQSDGFIRHMTTTFDVLLMDRRADKHVKRTDWLDYLRSSFAGNKPYDKLVAEILSADGSDPKTRPAAKFFLDRDGEPNAITKDLSRLFLGMNLTCCQCHDHPLVDGYKQQHYYGILAFLNRSFLYTDKATRVSVLAEKGEGDVSFQSVFMAKVTKNTGPQLPDGPALVEPKFDKGKEYVVAFKPGEKPQPKFSRRAKLANELTANPRFARAAVNRFWSLYLGRGIVHPVDLDHGANPPSHPELLKTLADDFAGRKFDVTGLVREIVTSKTYQRSSAIPKGVTDFDPAAFAVYPLRPLTPEQFAWSMMQATGLIDAERKAQPKAEEKAVFAKLAGNVQAFVSLFGNQPGEPFDPNAFEATLDQTLFLDNGALLRGWLAPRPGNLTQRLADLKDAGAVAEELYLGVLTRQPTAEERKETADFLTQRAADRPAAIQDLAWALLASAEFRFNH